MDSRALIVKPETRTPAINVLGVMVTVLASGDATGSGEITLQEGQEGMGPRHTATTGTSRSSFSKAR